MEEVPMRKVIVSEFVSLDGVMEDPGRTFQQFGSEEQEKYKFAELAASEALLLGRRTYEEFAGAWPSMMDQYQGPRRAELGEYADMMNAYPKRVVSTTLQEPLEWNNSTLIRGNVAEEVSELKRQPGKDILVFGSGSLVGALIRDDLIDEYRLMVFPIVVGSGKRLFEDGLEVTNLSLVETTTFGSGVVVLTYRSARDAGEDG
jgi:dihydrofolate reductase